MYKIFLFISFLLAVNLRISGQISATATAAATFVLPVGTENSFNLMKGSFKPGMEPGIVEINYNGKNLTDKVRLSSVAEKVELPSFRVVSDQSIYSITFSYDPVIINESASNESIRIESLEILKEKKSNNEEIKSEKYSIGASIRIGPSQIPGFYSANSPCAVTINYN